MPNSFLFDPNRCTGCHACGLACTIENELGPAFSWRRIETFNAGHAPTLPLYHLSLACNHCAEPACMYACPALAYSRDTATGAVLLDADKCIGCKYCSWACPYDAPTFDADRGVMTKCTFCNHRLVDGSKPACATHCPTGALDFGDVAESGLIHAIDGFPETQLGPRIRIKPLEPGRRVPDISAPAAQPPSVATTDPSLSDISLRSEWSLVLFTILAAALVAVVAAAATAGPAVAPLPFLLAAAVTMALGSAHLGRKSRAWRAVLNLRRSWLSREIVTLSAFFGLASFYLAFFPHDRVFGASVTALGFLALFCTDQVYGVLRRAGPGYRHSAGVLWTGFFLTGILAADARLALAFGLGKLVLYAVRKLGFAREGKPVRGSLTTVRVGVGLLLPGLLWLIDPGGLRVGIVVAALAGELIDRSEYYLEIERETPARRMAEALRMEIGAGVRSRRVA